MTTIVWLAAAALALNIPCGYWRRGSARFSLPWIFFVHVSVPFIIAARLLLGIGMAAVPMLMTSAFVGQMAGGWIRRCGARGES